MINQNTKNPSLPIILLLSTLTGAVIGIFFQQKTGSCGDYPQHFRAVATAAGMGFLFGLVFYLLRELIPYAWRIEPLLTGFLRYFLAGIMFTYGIAKVIPIQFPYLEANMDSTFRELTPMRIAWTFMGYSKGYQMLCGWAEVIPTLLLLWRRTYLLGALLMTVVLVNVVSLNFFFDICVKLNSSIYLAVAVGLLLTGFDRLWAFFITNEEIPAVKMESLWQNTRHHRMARIANALIIGLILLAAFWRAFDAWEHLQITKSPNPVKGVWQTQSLEIWRDTTWQAIHPRDSFFYHTVYFEGPYGLLKTAHGRERLILSPDSLQQTIKVTFSGPKNEWPLERVWKYENPARDQLLLHGRMWEDSVRMELKRKKFLKSNYPIKFVIPKRLNHDPSKIFSCARDSFFPFQTISRPN